MHQRPFRLALTFSLALLLSACQDSQFTIFGYTTAPNYYTNIHTVRVPIFKNNTFYRGLEFQLTQAVVREIEAKTPYKVVGADCAADTELTGRIAAYNKTILNRNQLNEVREAETLLTVEVTWRDLRSGEILSRPRTGPGAPPALPPDALPGSPPPPPAPPVIVTSLGHFVPELGGTLASAEKENVDRLAIQIVSMMEKPW